MSDQKVDLQAIATARESSGPGDPGYVPPAEVVPLPSQGMVYSPGDPLSGAEFLEIRAMTARDEDILTSRALLKSGKAMDTLLKSCIVDRSVDPGKMLTGDRNAAMVAIRITGYGTDYKVKVSCPSCGEQSENEFDLSLLPIKRLEAQPLVPCTNEFEFLLPVSKQRATFKLLTGDEEREIAAILDRTRKVGGSIDSLVTTRLHFALLSLGGERDRAKLADRVRSMPARDSRELRSYIERISPGVEMKQNFVCPSCSFEGEVDVPMGTEFFWPST